MIVLLYLCELNERFRGNALSAAQTSNYILLPPSLMCHYHNVYFSSVRLSSPVHILMCRTVSCKLKVSHTESVNVSVLFEGSVLLVLSSCPSVGKLDAPTLVTRLDELSLMKKAHKQLP